MNEIKITVHLNATDLRQFIDEAKAWGDKPERIMRLYCAEFESLISDQFRLPFDNVKVVVDVPDTELDRVDIEGTDDIWESQVWALQRQVVEDLSWLGCLKVDY